MNKRLILGGCFLLILSAVLYFCRQGQGQEQSKKDYDWTISITTEELSDYFTFPGNNLKPIVKVRVSYKDKQMTKGADVAYEDLYFRGCDAIGARRFSVLKIDNTGLGSIRVEHKKSPSSGETCAAANTIVRLLLDTYILGDAPAVVLVPSASFSAISQDLRHENFFPFEGGPDEGVRASIVLSLASEPDGNRQSMYYGN